MAVLMGSLLWGPCRQWLSGLPAASPDSFPGNRAQHSGPDNILHVLRCPECGRVDAWAWGGEAQEWKPCDQPAGGLTTHGEDGELCVLQGQLPQPSQGQLLTSHPPQLSEAHRRYYQVLGISRNPWRPLAQSPYFPMRTLRWCPCTGRSKTTPPTWSPSSRLSALPLPSLLQIWKWLGSDPHSITYLLWEVKLQRLPLCASIFSSVKWNHKMNLMLWEWDKMLGTGDNVSLWVLSWNGGGKLCLSWW